MGGCAYVHVCMHSMLAGIGMGGYTCIHACSMYNLLDMKER